MALWTRLSYALMTKIVLGWRQHCLVEARPAAQVDSIRYPVRYVDKPKERSLSSLALRGSNPPRLPCDDSALPLSQTPATFFSACSPGVSHRLAAFNPDGDAASNGAAH